MTRRDWLLLFVAYEGAPDGLDPVRMQKGMFLFAMEADLPASQKYRFKPYDYGPMSATVYSDLDRLVDDGYLIRRPQPNKSWARYKPGPKALAAGHRLLGEIEKEGRLPEAHRLYQIKQSVSSVGFSELLETVYERYPDYAVRSVFRRV